MFGKNYLETGLATKECKPDYEEMASRLRKRIDADIQCLNGMKTGIEFGSINLNSDGEILYYAIIGTLSMSIPKKEEEYMNLLSQIEKE